MIKEWFIIQLFPYWWLSSFNLRRECQNSVKLEDDSLVCSEIIFWPPKCFLFRQPVHRKKLQLFFKPLLEPGGESEIGLPTLANRVASWWCEISSPAQPWATRKKTFNLCWLRLEDGFATKRCAINEFHAKIQ